MPTPVAREPAPASAPSTLADSEGSGQEGTRTEHVEGGGGPGHRCQPVPIPGLELGRAGKDWCGFRAPALCYAVD
jgi:hypothetical protein